MTIEQMIANEVQGTESGKKLFKMLSNIFSNKENIENVILLLETEENRQKIIQKYHLIYGNNRSLENQLNILKIKKEEVWKLIAATSTK